MKDLVQAFLTTYLPKDIDLPEDTGEFYNCLYRFPNTAAAQRFIDAINPFFPHKISNNTVEVLLVEFFKGVLRVVCSFVLLKYKDNLTFGSLLEAGPRDFNLARVLKAPTHKLADPVDTVKEALTEIGLKNIGEVQYTDYTLLRILLDSTNFDVGPLTATAHKAVRGSAFKELTQELAAQKDMLRYTLQEHIRASGQMIQFGVDGRGNDRLICNDENALTQFSQAVLISKFGYNWKPENQGRAMPRGGNSNSTFLVGINFNDFSTHYKAAVLLISLHIYQQCPTLMAKDLVFLVGDYLGVGSNISASDLQKLKKESKEVPSQALPTKLQPS